MSHPEKKPSGCGCLNIPISVILLFLGGGYWWFTHKGIPDISNVVNKIQEIANIPTSAPTPNTIPAPTPTLPSTPPSTANLELKNTPQPQSQEDLSPIIKPAKTSLTQTPWEKKVIRGIYLSRYQITNNANEQMIRQRVRYYHSQGINTIIHGVWGNACTMYNSKVMEQTLGYISCPNKFRDQWLDWLIDEAHKQGMEVHAYFEKGIKIDKNSPIFDFAITQRWIIPGVDRTYSGIDHYLLDVEIPEVANFFRDILVEFVQKYPSINAVQWDDYLGYHAELPGQVDRTESLTKFVRST